MTKTPAAVIAMHGVLKTGAMYVPLDPGSPAQRLERMIAACDDRWILGAGPVGSALRSLCNDAGFASKHSIGWLGEWAPPSGVALGFHESEIASLPVDPPAIPFSRHDAAHILFTSGSTGTPKGVMITHDSVVHFLEWATSYFGIPSADRTSGHPPLHFDLSTFDIFGTLAAGAELHMVPPELNLLPHRLADFIR